VTIAAGGDVSFRSVPTDASNEPIVIEELTVDRIDALYKGNSDWRIEIVTQSCRHDTLPKQKWQLKIGARLTSFGNEPPKTKPTSMRGQSDDTSPV